MAMDTDQGQQSRFRAWRLAHGLRQADIADLSGLSVSYISLIERGRRDLAPAGKGRLARALGARVRDLFELDDGDGQAA